MTKYNSNKRSSSSHHPAKNNHSSKMKNDSSSSKRREDDVHKDSEHHAMHRAVSLGFLLDFTYENDCWDLATGEVMQRFVAPATDITKERPEAVRYTELLPSEQVGNVSVFVSHTWSNPFGLIVAMAQKFASDWKERHPHQELFFWIDIFAINQHQPEQRGHDIGQLDDVVKVSTNVLLVLDLECKPLTRVWCLFEIMIALAHGGYGKLQMRCGSLDDTTKQIIPVQDPDTLRHMSEEVDLENAEASVQSDRDMIFAEVERLFPKQGFGDVNRAVRRLLRKGW